MGIFGDEFEKQRKLDYPRAASRIIRPKEVDFPTRYLKERVHNEQQARSA